jgi:glycosyltransferase involved in cell wall biosynthesis
MPGSERLKLLVIAPGCDSTAVGEGGSTFQWVSRLGQHHELTLLTLRNRSRGPIAWQLEGIRVIEWPEWGVFEDWPRFNSMVKPSYLGFYVQARRWLKKQLRAGETFDLIHQISPLALRYPSPGVGLGIPFVIGPLGGSLENPQGFTADFGKVPWYTQLRNLDEWRLRYDPLLRRTYGRADKILAVAPYVKDLLGDLPCGEVEMMTETGIASLPLTQSAGNKDSEEIRLLFVGRVIRSKGLRDGIRALALLKDVRGIKFDVVGDGDDLAACKRESERLGVSNQVTFHGRLPRNQVDKFYAAADIFVFPSFREPSGNVVVEAMSYGLPVITADRGGPGFVVDESCGFKVPALDPDQFAPAIAACIRTLINQPDLIKSMGRAAREKIKREFLWHAKVQRLERIYGDVLAHSATAVLQIA